jgi:CRP-like cAMP-binding protein
MPGNLCAMARKSNLDETLRQLPVFAHCSNDELRAIDALADPIDVDAGRVLTREGELGHEFIVMVSGEAEVTRNGKHVATLSAGDHFGELAILSDRPRNATITVTRPSRIEVIERRGFRTLLEDTPSLALSLLMSVADRLSELES